jgi:hypothetical protein
MFSGDEHDMGANAFKYPLLLLLYFWDVTIGSKSVLLIRFAGWRSESAIKAIF